MLYQPGPSLLPSWSRPMPSGCELHGRVPPSLALWCSWDSLGLLWVSVQLSPTCVEESRWAFELGETSHVFINNFFFKSQPSKVYICKGQNVVWPLQAQLILLGNQGRAYIKWTIKEYIHCHQKNSILCLKSTQWSQGTGLMHLFVLCSKRNSACLVPSVNGAHILSLWTCTVEWR